MASPDENQSSQTSNNKCKCLDRCCAPPPQVAAAATAVNQNPEEAAYLHLIEDIIENGYCAVDRTKIGTHSSFGVQFRFDLSNGTIPLLTTKRMHFKSIVEELVWFISGSTNVADLQKKNVKIWNANSSREFLNERGLYDNEVGDVGPMYGFQWRHFGAKYYGCREDYTGQGYDQLKWVISRLKNEPNCRRICMTAWNPQSIDQMALPPCHCFVQFSVRDGALFSSVYMRSGDIGLGVPFNIASYAILTHLLAHLCDLSVGSMVFSIGDAHVYKNHIDGLREQCLRQPYRFPTLQLSNRITDIDCGLQLSDFILCNYEHHPAIAMPMAV